MEEMAWEIETQDDFILRGTDRFPAPEERLRVKRFRLTLPFMDGLFSFVIPDGGRLIFLRENCISAGAVVEFSFAYYVGYAIGDKKAVNRIEPIRVGDKIVATITILHDDGRTP